MIFDEDTILLSFFDRYTVPDEIEDLKLDVLKYIGGGVTQKMPVAEQDTTGDSLDGMSSPMDSAVDMKKRNRLRQLKAAQEKQDTAVV